MSSISPSYNVQSAFQRKRSQRTTHRRGPKLLCKGFRCYVHRSSCSCSTAKQTRALFYPCQPNITKTCMKRWHLDQSTSTLLINILHCRKNGFYQNIARFKIPVDKWWFLSVHKLQSVTTLFSNAEFVFCKQLWFLLNVRDTKLYAV